MLYLWYVLLYLCCIPNAYSLLSFRGSLGSSQLVSKLWLNLALGYNIFMIIRLHRITIFYGEQFMRYIIASHFIVIFSFILRSFLSSRITISVVLTLPLIVHSKKTKWSGDAQLAHVYEGAKGPTSSVESLML